MTYDMGLCESSYRYNITSYRITLHYIVYHTSPRRLPYHNITTQCDTLHHDTILCMQCNAMQCCANNNDIPDAMTKYLSFQLLLNMLSFVFFIIRVPAYTTAERMAAILSAFLSSFDRLLSALSAFDPPLKPSLCVLG